MDYNNFLNIRKNIIEKEFSRMNDMQKKAVFRIKGPLLILAGAGSGKTTVLVNRISNLLKYGDAYNSEKSSRTPDEYDVELLQVTALCTMKYVMYYPMTLPCRGKFSL